MRASEYGFACRENEWVAYLLEGECMRLVRPITAVAILMAAFGAHSAETITYTYDALGRLVQVVRTGSVNNNVQATYTLDPAGNRVSVQVVKP